MTPAFSALHERLRTLFGDRKVVLAGGTRLSSRVHELHHLLTAIRDDSEVAPHGATFEDGYRCAEVCDAILRSADSGSRPCEPRTQVGSSGTTLIA